MNLSLIIFLATTVFYLCSGKMKDIHHTKQRYRTIADILRTEIKARTYTLLPSLAQLCKRFDVSLKTIVRAVDLLKSEALVESAAGSRSRISAAYAPDTTDSNRSAEKAPSHQRFHQALKDAIKSKQIAPGEKLPSFKELKSAYNVSFNTISETMQRLKSDGAIHKTGSAWIAGPPQQSKIETREFHQPPRATALRFIVMLVPEYKVWSYYCQSPLWRRFFTDFNAEISRFSLRPLVCSRQCSSDYSYSPAGEQDIMAYIQKAGDQYAGTLIASNLAEFDGIENWIRLLTHFKEPVIWLDIDDEGSRFDRRNIARKNFYHCFISQRQLVQTALQKLVAQGHTNIGYPLCTRTRYKNWIEKRLELFRDEIKDHYPGVRLHTTIQDEALWQAPNVDKSAPVQAMEDLIADICKHNHEDPAKRNLSLESRQALYDRMPSLGELIAEKKCTALIAPNDWLAVNYLIWCNYIGIRVPEQLSIISFDNMLIYQDSRLSTVDFNLATLGRRCAHILADAYSIKTDRWGNVGCEPYVNDRGSLGKPSGDRQKFVNASGGLKPGGARIARSDTDESGEVPG